MSYIKKIHSWQSASEELERLRREGMKIVFTNGCFDLIHKGHIAYLEKAKYLGDVLVLGLNSDESVKRLKGQGRPVKEVENRMAVMAGLSSVDLVVVFESDTPKELIHFLKPDVLVKGGDYKVEDIVGADFVKANGGEVVTVEFVDGYSSSALIRKIEN